MKLPNIIAAINHWLVKDSTLALNVYHAKCPQCDNAQWERDVNQDFQTLIDRVWPYRMSPLLTFHCGHEPFVSGYKSEEDEAATQYAEQQATPAQLQQPHIHSSIKPKIERTANCQQSKARRYNEAEKLYIDRVRRMAHAFKDPHSFIKRHPIASFFCDLLPFSLLPSAVSSPPKPRTNL